MGIAPAATYSYTPANTATDVWSAGTDWDVTPVSDPDATLVFGPAAYADLTAITNTNTNDFVTPFQLNVLTLQGTGPATTGFPVAVTIAGGVLNFVNSSGAVAPVINLTAGNGGGTSTVSYNLNSAITLGNTTTITGDGNASFTISGAISGAAGLNKSGASVVTLSGANSYTGNTSINGGVVKISAANNLGDATQATNTISLSNGATLDSTAGTYDLGVNRAITLNGPGTIQSDAGVLTVSGNVANGANLLTVTGAGGTTISGVISGTAGGVSKTGAGTLTLSGANTYAGNTSINGGTLNLGSAGALGGGGNISFGGGTLQFSAANQNDYSPLIANSAGAVKIDTNSQNIIFATPLAATNTGGFTKTGAGTLTFNAANAYTGTTTVTGGTLAYGVSDATGSGDVAVNGAGAVLDLGADHTDTVGTVTVDGGGSITGTGVSALTSTGTYEMKNGTVTAILAGAVPLNKTTAGTVTLSGANTYTGNTTINGGVLKISAANNLGDGSATNTISLNNGATLNSTGGTYALGINRVITLNGIGTIQTDAGVLTVDGNIINGANTLTVTGAGATTISGTIGNGSGGLTKTGAGTLTLSAANTYTGLTSVTGGTLAYGISDATGSGDVAVNGAGAILNLGADHTDTVGTVTVDGGGSITGTGVSALTSTGTYEMKNGTVTAILAGAVPLNKTTAGTVTLSGANTYSGNTAINGGILKISASSNLGDGSATNTISMTGGTLNSTANIYDLTPSRAITLNGAGTIQTDAGTLTVSGAVSNGTNLLTVSGAGNTTISGVIGGGSGGISKIGAGILTLSGANTYTGNTAVNGGTLSLANASALGGGGNLSFGGGKLQYTAASAGLDLSARILNSTAAVQIDPNGQTVTFASPLASSNAGGLTLAATGGTGTLALNAANAYVGTTTVTGGLLKVGVVNALGSTTNGVSLAGGTLDLATDTSVNPYNVTVAATSTINSDTATAASAGINHTLGTLSIGAQTLNIGPGANVASGTPRVTFGPVTVSAAGAVFSPNLSSALSLGTVTGTNTGITFGGTSTGVNSVGAISIGTGVITKSTAATWDFTGTGTSTGAINITGGGLTQIGADNPWGTVGTLTVSSGTAVIQSDSNAARVVGNPFTFTAGGAAIGGTGNLTFTGKFTFGTAGGGTMSVTNTGLTTFHGGVQISQNTSNRTWGLLGTGSVTVDSPITSNPTVTAGQSQGISWGSTGTLTLSGVNTYGTLGSLPTTALNLGTTILAAPGSMAATAITVGNGAAITATAGNALLQIAGNYTVGTVGPSTLAIRGGDGLASGRGTLSLVDGGKNTLTINNSTATATTNVLTLAGAAGAVSVLNMEVGNGGADQITLSAGRLSVGAGGVTVNLTGIGNVAEGTYTLINSPSAAQLTGAFALGTSSGNFGGFTSAVLGASPTGLTVTLGGLTPAPDTAYWTGLQGSGGTGSWDTFTGGLSNNSNWSTDAAGTVNSMQKPGANTDVFFSANGSANTTTTLGTNASVKSITFTGTGGAASIGGASTLTVGAGGITVNSDAATPTISAPVALGESQTWTNSSAGDFIVSGSVSGSGKTLTKAGTGALVLSGNNTFTGGVVIDDGAVRVANAGALNSSAPNSVTFGPGAPSTARLQTNGNNITIGALSTDATPGSPIVENANALASTLTVSQSTNTTFAGVIQDGTGGGALGIRKSGVGALTLAGANTYTGNTNINNGALYINGSTSASSPVTVNSGATLGGTGTVGGAVNVNAGGRITAGTSTDTGALALGGNLTLNSGSYAYMNVVNSTTFDSFAISGNLTLGAGSAIRVTGGLTTPMIITLMTYSGADPNLTGYSFLTLDGNLLSDNYSFSASGGSLKLTIAAPTTAIPTIDMSAPTAGTRVMNSTTVNVTGNFGNSGTVDLHGVLSDNGGDLTITSIAPAGSNTVAPSGSMAYTGSVNTGAVLGNRTLSIKVSDPTASPNSANVSSSLTVLDNRTVTAPALDFGPVHVGATVTGSTGLTSAQPDNQYTRVTVANGSNGAGFSVSGGNPDTIFDGSTSDTRTLSGVFNSVGSNQTGSVVLTTTGEAGVSGQNPINVSAGYGSTSVYSGQAAWKSAAATSSWDIDNNWGDTNVANLNGAGTPGVDGAVSAGDTATFADVVGAGATTTVNLDGANPSLAGLTFNSTVTSYTLAAGSGGSISLQNAATPVAVTGTHTISAGLVGPGGLAKSGTGTLLLSAASTYAGATTVNNGIVQLVGSANRLPTTSTVTLGSGTSSGKLILGNSSAAVNQGIAGLLTSGTGTANAVVGGNAAISALTVNVASGVDTYSGAIGGAGTNENNLSLSKGGTGTLVLTQAPTYIGNTSINSGVLQVPSAANLSASYITFSATSLATAGVLQTNGTITRALSTTANAANLNWVSFNGFAAKGGPLTLTFTQPSSTDPTQLTWGGNGFMGTGGATMVLGSTTADNKVILTNNINLVATDGFQRPIYVEKGLGGDSAELSGVLSPNLTGTVGLSKQGPGTLILSGLNTYNGPTTVTAGTLIVRQDSFSDGATPGALGVATSAIALAAANNSSASLMIDGAHTVARQISTGGATTGTYSIGGLTDNTATFSGAIGAGQPLSVTQVATTGSNALNITGGISATVTVTFDNVGAVNVTGAPITGGGVLIQNGSGITTIGMDNSYTGGTTINSGRLVGGSLLAFGAGPVTLSGGQLGVTNGLNSELDVVSLTWNSGGTIKMDLSSIDSTFVLLRITDAFTQGTGGAFNFDFGNTGVVGNTYTLINFGTTTFTDANSFFSMNGGGQFQIVDNNLIYTAVTVPEPTTVALWLAGIGLVVIRERKRIHRLIKGA